MSQRCYMATNGWVSKHNISTRYIVYGMQMLKDRFAFIKDEPRLKNIRNDNIP